MEVVGGENGKQKRLRGFLENDNSTQAILQKAELGNSTKVVEDTTVIMEQTFILGAKRPENFY